MILIIIVVLIILLALTYKYPMVSLFLFLTTSVVKATLMYKFAIFRIVDWTVVCAVYVLFAMLFCVAKYGLDIRKVINVPFRLLLVLAVILFFGLLYTSAPNYGWQKASRFAVFGLISFLAPIVFGVRPSDIKKIVWVLFIVGVVLAAGTILTPQSVLQEREGPRAGFLEGGPLDTAEKVAIASIAAFCFAMMTETPKILKVISISFIPLFVIVILLTGSRGSFFGMIICWLLTPLVFRKKIPRMWTIFVFAFVVIAMIYSFAYVAESSKESAYVAARISETWKMEHGLQAVLGARLGLFKQAISGFLESPILGHGTGAFGFDYSGFDIRIYPHNIILELLYENGLMGALIICFFLWLIFRKWRQAVRYIDAYLFEPGMLEVVSMSGLFFIFEFLQAMKTSDLDGNRFMFFCAGLLLASYHCVQNTANDLIAESEAMTEGWPQSEEGGFQNAEVFY